MEPNELVENNDRNMDSITYNKLSIHEALCNNIRTLYDRKNSDYGDSVSDTFNKFGIDAFLVRMYDKINRVYSLTRPDVKQMVQDEKIEDTLLDLANYALIALTELQYRKSQANGGN